MLSIGDCVICNSYGQPYTSPSLNFFLLPYMRGDIPLILKSFEVFLFYLCQGKSLQDH